MNEITDTIINELETSIDRCWNWLGKNTPENRPEEVYLSKYKKIIDLCSEAENLLATARENQYEYLKLDSEIKLALTNKPNSDQWLPQTMKRHAIANVNSTLFKIKATIFELDNLIK